MPAVASASKSGSMEKHKITTIKRLLTLLLAVMTALSMAMVLPATDAFAAGKVKTINYKMVPYMSAIKVKWKKQNVSYYLIYRTEFKVKSVYEIEPVPMSAYKRVKKLSGSKAAWTDRNVKKNRYYDYVIRGYRKAKGRDKLVCTSYRKGVTNYQCPGLQRPDLINGGYGENYSNSKSRLYLYVQRTDGVTPTGAVIYRKAEGDSGYKKIKVSKAEKGSFKYGKTYADSSVTPGQTYYYKARTYVKTKKGNRYSSYSKAVKLSAVNFTGTYTVRAMTEPGTVEDFTIHMVSDEDNGVLTMEGGSGYEGPVYMTKTGSEDYGAQSISLEAYSDDGTTWMEIPPDGLIIKAGQAVWLRFRFSSGSGYFSAGSGEYSDIDFMYEKTSYAGSAGFGTTETVIKLKEGTATAFPDYDN